MQNTSNKRAFLIILLFLVAAFFAIISPFLLPALFAGLVVIICQPIYKYFYNLFKRRRYLASTASTIVASLCILLPLALIIGIIVSNATQVINQIMEQLQTGQIAVAIDNINLWLSDKIRQYAEFLPPDFNIRMTLVSILKSISQTIYQYSPKFLIATAAMLTGFLLLLIFTFVFFAEGERIYNSILSLLPLRDEHKMVLAKEVQGVVSGTFLGMVGTSLSQGILIGVGFWIAGIPEPFIWGLVSVGVTLVPVIGGPLMYVPAAIVQLINGHTASGIFLLIFGISVVSTIDNLIKPIILRGKVKAHPILLAISLIGGGMWLGPAGIIIGPLVVVLLLAMLRIYQKEFV